MCIVYEKTAVVHSAVKNVCINSYKLIYRNVLYKLNTSFLGQKVVKETSEPLAEVNSKTKMAPKVQIRMRSSKHAHEIFSFFTAAAVKIKNFV